MTNNLHVPKTQQYLFRYSRTTSLPFQARCNKTTQRKSFQTVYCTTCLHRRRLRSKPAAFAFSVAPLLWILVFVPFMLLFWSYKFFIVKSILPLEINLKKFVWKIFFKVFHLLNIKPKSVWTLEKTSCTKYNDIVFEYKYHSVILNLPYCFHCIWI